MLRMLVTRPEPDASETAGKLSALGIEPVVEPLLRFQTLPTSLPEPAGFAALILTSTNALRALAERRGIADFLGLKVFAVGDRTAAAAAAEGFANVTSAGGNLDDLVGLIAKAGLTGPVFYPAARERAGNLGKALAAHGIMAITTEIYAMAPSEKLSNPVRIALEAGDLDAGLFYSRRTAEAFIALTEGIPRRADLRLLCLSEAVAAPFMKAHLLRVSLAEHPSEEAMLSLALSFARDQKRGMIAP
jgi:uroporphyrinogen-III synthase